MPISLFGPFDDAKVNYFEFYRVTQNTEMANQNLASVIGADSTDTVSLGERDRLTRLL